MHKWAIVTLGRGQLHPAESFFSSQAQNAKQNRVSNRRHMYTKIIPALLEKQTNKSHITDLALRVPTASKITCMTEDKYLASGLITT